MAHEGYHEPVDRLTPATMDFHRAIVSLIEELEAVDWYNQRVDACADPALKAKFSELGLDVAAPAQQTPEGLAAFQKAEIEKWWPIIKGAGIKAE